MVMEYTNLKEGEHEARLAYVAGLGLQKREYKGEVKPPCKQISLCFEVLGSTVKIDGVVRPRTIWHKGFNVFGKMSGLSTEYAMYKAFVPTAEEDTTADWESVLGEPVNIIIKNEERNGNVYDTVTGVTSIPSKYRDSVDESTITNQCVGDAEDADSPAIKSLFGLARWKHGNRLATQTKPTETNDPVVAEDEVSFDNDVPF